MNARRLPIHSISFWCATVLFLLAAPPARPTEPTNTLLHAVSVSRQFVAYASSPLLPPALCVFAERIKSEWLARLETTDSWRDPIVIVIRQRDAAQGSLPALTLDVFQTEARLKYQVQCQVPPPVDEQALLTAVVGALCAEMANRAQPVSRSTPYYAAPVPPWIVQGLASSIHGRTDILLAAARRSFAAGRPQTATELIEATVLPDDPMENQLFRANAWLLTENLLLLPSGARKMQRYLAELAVRRSSLHAFLTVYKDDFPDQITLEKWWGLQLARRTTAMVARNLTAEETARELDTILLTRLPSAAHKTGASAETEVPLRELWQYYEQKWLKQILDEKLLRLRALSSQAQARDREVIEHYIEAINWLGEEKINRFKRAAQRAEEARLGARLQSNEISEYLDRVERIYAPEELAALFDGYFQQLDQFQSIDQQRRSPVSDYLDKFDR